LRQLEFATTFFRHVYPARSTLVLSRVAIPVNEIHSDTCLICSAYGNSQKVTAQFTATKKFDLLVGQRESRVTSCLPQTLKGAIKGVQVDEEIIERIWGTAGVGMREGAMYTVDESRRTVKCNASDLCKASQATVMPLIYASKSSFWHR
jgi:hypothetical protein